MHAGAFIHAINHYYTFPFEYMHNRIVVSEYLQRRAKAVVWVKDTTNLPESIFTVHLTVCVTV